MIELGQWKRERRRRDMADWNSDETLTDTLDIPVFKKQRPRASSTCSPETYAQVEMQRLGRRQSSEPTLSVEQNEEINSWIVPNGRKRSSSHSVVPSDEVDDYFIKRNSKALTENAKKLSQDELHSLVLDIFKPLDFYEILFDRMKKNDGQKEKTDKQD